MQPVFMLDDNGALDGVEARPIVRDFVLDEKHGMVLKSGFERPHIGEEPLQDSRFNLRLDISVTGRGKVMRRIRRVRCIECVRFHGPFMVLSECDFRQRDCAEVRRDAVNMFSESPDNHPACGFLSGVTASI